MRLFMFVCVIAAGCLFTSSVEARDGFFARLFQRRAANQGYVQSGGSSGQSAEPVASYGSSGAAVESYGSNGRAAYSVRVRPRTARVVVPMSSPVYESACPNCK